MVVIGGLVLLVGAWFGLAGPRADLADRKRTEAITVQDTARSYRLARLAAGLDGSAANLTTYAAAAFRLSDYDQAARHFKQATNDGSRNASSGWVVSAALGSDRSGFDQAEADFGTPRNDSERAVLANAWLTAGSFEQLQEPNDRPASYSEAAARAVGVAETDPARAIRLLQASSSVVTISVDDSLLKQVLENQIAWPDDSKQKLATTFTAMQRPVSRATRQALLADRLLELDRSRTAAELANRAVKNEPRYRDGWNTLAAAQYRLGKYEEADRSLAVSLKLDDAFGFTWYLRSQVADKQGRTADAIAYQDKAKRLGYDK